MASDEQVLLMSNQLQAFELKTLLLTPKVHPVTTAAAQAPVPVSPDLEPQRMVTAPEDTLPLTFSVKSATARSA